MIQIIPYILYILLSANGQPTGYAFIYSSNHNTHASEQEENDNPSDEDHTDTYQYEDVNDSDFEKN